MPQPRLAQQPDTQVADSARSAPTRLLPAARAQLRQRLRLRSLLNRVLARLLDDGLDAGPVPLTEVVGAGCVEIIVRVGHGGDISHAPAPADLPDDTSTPQASTPQAVAVAPVREWASGPVPKILHDGARLYWPGLGVFVFRGDLQRRVICELWDAYQAGTHEVPQRSLLIRVGSDALRLVDLFRRAAGVWGRLIVQGQVPGSYRFAPLPAAGEGEG